MAFEWIEHWPTYERFSNCEEKYYRNWRGKTVWGFAFSRECIMAVPVLQLDPFWLKFYLVGLFVCRATGNRLYWDGTWMASHGVLSLSDTLPLPTQIVKVTNDEGMRPLRLWKSVSAGLAAKTAPWWIAFRTLSFFPRVFDIVLFLRKENNRQTEHGRDRSWNLFYVSNWIEHLLVLSKLINVRLCCSLSLRRTCKSQKCIRQRAKKWHWVLPCTL